MEENKLEEKNLEAESQVEHYHHHEHRHGHHGGGQGCGCKHGGGCHHGYGACQCGGCHRRFILLRIIMAIFIAGFLLCLGVAIGAHLRNEGQYGMFCGRSRMNSFSGQWQPVAGQAVNQGQGDQGGNFFPMNTVTPNGQGGYNIQ